MVTEESTLDPKRPTTLDEKRRIERELGLPVEPAIVMPRGNDWSKGKLGVWARVAGWLRGTLP